MLEILEIPIELLESVKYDEKSPSGLIWIKPKQKRKVGGIAGCKQKNGYWVLKFNYKQYQCHRVVFKLHNKINIQHTEIDHEDKNPSNNTIENLRIASSSQQNCNTGIPRNNTSGIKGVYFHKKTNKWKAQIMVNGKNYHLGLFDCKYEAEKVAIKAREELHKEFACHGGVECQKMI